jgi:hypothetical protein
MTEGVFRSHSPAQFRPLLPNQLFGLRFTSFLGRAARPQAILFNCFAVKTKSLSSGDADSFAEPTITPSRENIIPRQPMNHDKIAQHQNLRTQVRFRSRTRFGSEGASRCQTTLSVSILATLPGGENDWECIFAISSGQCAGSKPSPLVPRDLPRGQQGKWQIELTTYFDN